MPATTKDHPGGYNGVTMLLVCDKSDSNKDSNVQTQNFASTDKQGSLAYQWAHRQHTDDNNATGQCKQYSTDVCTSMSLCIMMLHHLKSPEEKAFGRHCLLAVYRTANPPGAVTDSSESRNKVDEFCVRSIRRKAYYFSGASTPWVSNVICSIVCRPTKLRAM